MKQSLDVALDESLTLLETGQATLAECLERYPAYAAELRPLLEVALVVRRVPAPTPSPDASIAGRRRMLEALIAKKRRQAVHTGPLRRYLGQIVALFTEAGQPSVQRREPGFRFVAVTIAALVLLAFFGLVLLPWARQGVVQAATLSQVTGRVEVRPVGSEAWHIVLAGERVKAGDCVRTASNATATLAFFDGSTTALEAGTEVTIVQASLQRGDGGRTIVLNQAVGQTYSRVQQRPDAASRFEIETPTAVVAVRGTEFSLVVDADGTTHLVVVDGEVSVTAQGTTVLVMAGQQISVRAGQPLTPTSVVGTPRATVTAVPTSPSATPSGPPQPPGLTRTPEPPGLTKTPEPPGLTKTPEPPGLTKTPEPPGLTKTPEPPGLTKTPEPPGLTKTPEPPGQTKTPEPPGLTKTPEPTEPPVPTEAPTPTPVPEPTQVPPGQTKTPEPPGQTKTPEPPGQTKTPEPPGQTKTPEPPGQTKTPKP